MEEGNLRIKIEQACNALEKYNSWYMKTVRGTFYGTAVALGLMISAVGVRIYNNHQASKIPIIKEFLKTEKKGNKIAAEKIRQTPKFRSYVPLIAEMQKKEDHLKYAATGIVGLSVLQMTIGTIIYSFKRDKVTKELENNLQMYVDV